MFDDRSLITAEHLAALRPMLRHPTRYTQRLVEHLDFLPQGGQSWRRDLQILIPEVAGLPSDKDQWFIVSLGQFIRRRLPDFCVTDCSGRTVNLLTRVQHGHCLADFMIDRHLLDRERDVIAAASDPEDEVMRAYAEVYLPIFEMFTSVRKDLAPVAEEGLAALVELLGEREDRAARRATMFMKEMTGVGTMTQYLCWVRGRPGTPVRLTATYTMPDPMLLPKPSAPAGSHAGRLTRLRLRCRTARSTLYARLGVAPMPSTFPTPANDHAASYYFSLEPPPESSIPYLDWGLDNMIEADGREWVCAHSSVHVHNGGGLRAPGAPPKRRTTIPDSQIHAFFRLDPADHKQVMFAAVLNVVFVWLAEAGRLSSEIDGANAPWLALAPAVLLAYTAQQRRHYFARATRWIRIVLWLYLLMNIAFLVSISFDIASSGSFADRHGFSDDAVSIVMASASIIVFWIFAFLGWPYEQVVRRRFRRERQHKHRNRRSESALQAYVRVARWYGDIAGVSILASLAVMAGVLVAGWGPNRPAMAASPQPSATQKLQSSTEPEAKKRSGPKSSARLLGSGAREAQRWTLAP
jgi:hypothetical protein